jgi:hypothetical protein
LQRELAKQNELQNEVAAKNARLGKKKKFVYNTTK